MRPHHLRRRGVCSRWSDPSVHDGPVRAEQTSLSPGHVEKALSKPAEQGLHRLPGDKREVFRSELCEYLEQCPGFLEVGRVKTFGEPRVDWFKQGISVGALALLLP